MPLKTELHPRNKHRGQYDFEKLIEVEAELEKYTIETKYGNLSVDFFNPKAVRALNKALLKLHYGISYWEIPENYLCPPIPGRADYIHYMADLLLEECQIPLGQTIKCLDIGTGANSVYPIIGVSEYNWSFVGSDIDEKALEASEKNIEHNKSIKGKVELRLQQNPKEILEGIIQKGDFFQVSICNPPFHSSAKEVIDAAKKKQSNLKKRRIDKPVLNFGGQTNELWCEGGEFNFLKTYIQESKTYKKQCIWFTSLVSKKEFLDPLSEELKRIGASKVKIVEMKTGNKVSRVLCWNFLN